MKIADKRSKLETSHLKNEKQLNYQGSISKVVKALEAVDIQCFLKFANPFEFSVFQYFSIFLH